MALQPVVRLAGSSHVLRFQGSLVGVPQLTGASGEVVTPIVADDLALVTFTLADLSALDDATRRLPASVYDDTQPAGAAPHSPTVGGPSGIDGISAPSGPTWMQNVRVRAAEVFATSSAAPFISKIQELNPICALSPSGLPTVSFGVSFTAAGAAALDAGGCPVIVEIEIPVASTR